GVDWACDVGELAVAGGLDQPPLVLGDFRLDQLAPVRAEPVDRAFLVGADEARVTRDIRGENGGKPTLHGWLLLRGDPTGGPAMRCRGWLYGVSAAGRQVSRHTPSPRDSGERAQGSAHKLVRVRSATSGPSPQPSPGCAIARRRRA